MSAAEVRALIVDDDRSWQEILSEILQDVGMLVDVVAGLPEALAAIREKAHRIAVVDLSLGGSDHRNQDGLQVLQSLRLQDPACVAILLTGFATVELAVSALNEYGAFTCLRKETFRRAQFRDLVRQTMANAAAMTFPPRLGDNPTILPVAEGPRPAEALTGQHSMGQSFVGQALVVEDDAGWRAILAEILTDAGLHVHPCSSFGEALGRLRRDQYDVAVIDLSLANPLPVASYWNEVPGAKLDGYRLLASTRAGNIPTVVVSGVANPNEIERAYTEHKIFAYLQKQAFERDIFLNTVGEALAAPRTNRELESLTDREREVLELLAHGLTNKEIAESMVISTNTVKRHLKAVFDKLETHTRSGAVAKAVTIGVLREKEEND